MEATLSLAPCMYAVVCSQSTHKKWGKAQTTLVRKYETKWPAKVKEVVYNDGDVLSAQAQLSKLKPTYTCFLAHYSECSKTFVRAVHKLTREIDPATPYTDTIWGVLTGWEEEDCLRILQTEPLTIDAVTGNCPIPLEKFTTGVSYSEMEQCVAHTKSVDGTITRGACPTDITETLILKISGPRSHETGVDMIITSAHATESELNLGYCFKSGKLLCFDGQIHGKALDGRLHKLCRHDNMPTILSAAGNCLMGLIRDRNSMALAWIHSANVCQLMGYVVPTWYGYGGWGVHKYFINNPGRMTFAQAYFANQQSLIARLESHKAPPPIVQNHENVYSAKFGTKKIAGEQSHELSGLSYDQDTTVFYGDPAWEAKLALKSELWDYSSDVLPWTPLKDSDPNWSYWEFTVSTLCSGSWDCPVADDKITSPGRPPIHLFPSRVKRVKLIAGDAIVTCSFVMMSLEGQFDVGQIHKVQFATLDY